MIRRVLQLDRGAVFTYSVLLIALIAWADWRIEINVTLGFLYIFPLVLLGTIFNWWQLALVAAFCTLLSDGLDPFPGDMESARDLLVFLTLTITGLLSLNVTKSYRREMESLAARRAAEEQLEFLIESSPAAVLTMSADGEILLANPTAHRLLGVDAGMLRGIVSARPPRFLRFGDPHCELKPRNPSVDPFRRASKGWLWGIKSWRPMI